MTDEGHIAGLAHDLCVKWSAEDAVDEGFTTYALWDPPGPSIQRRERA